MKELLHQFLPENPNEFVILCIGFLGQLFFAGRILVQWILSEKAKKVVSPLVFWVFSIIGSYLFFVY
ncbi:MAG: lipid-A-disaccharide synthase N-terminal domain-containing protein, partial [Bacteroides sp.]